MIVPAARATYVNRWRTIKARAAALARLCAGGPEKRAPLLPTDYSGSILACGKPRHCGHCCRHSRSDASATPEK